MEKKQTQIVKKDKKLKVPAVFPKPASDYGNPKQKTWAERREEPVMLLRKITFSPFAMQIILQVLVSSFPPNRDVWCEKQAPSI